ncbi:NAD binding domain of 6-phosphogluconate dehydrogenase-domain-containing protein [Cercophora samala]|uniref:3-hydroxyisobutyrate dehydrogenase n=1 Tax=Cercophora samala TaxID=330535 RepID=A0AA39ZCS8_9PEZI|nr:NAD binding domain of 6-phosphogluconate dehydrogenase-domain-containing protein [Cercophora samala]
MELSSVTVTISALDAGYLTLPERLFATDDDPEKRTTVPSLFFLIKHWAPERAKPTRLLFDLGVKRDIQKYTLSQQAHIAERQPVIVSPDCKDSLLAHPSDYSSVIFLVGAGTLNPLKYGDGPLYPADFFNDDELPSDRTIELPPTSPFEIESNPISWTWKPLSTFPFTLDLFGDGAITVVNTPGHLYGHVSLICQVASTKYVYLGGDCCHDPGILTGDKGIALFEDGKGGRRSVHADKEAAGTSLDRIKDFVKSCEGMVDPEVIVAYDGAWRKGNKHRFWPGRLRFHRPATVSTMSSQEDTVAFIGLGVMGYPMAKNLRAGLGSDKSLPMCDVNSDAVERFMAEVSNLGRGTAVRTVQTGFDAAQQADTIITMLPNTACVLAVYLDPSSGILPALPECSGRKLLMECGTIESSTILCVSRSIPENQAAFVDAPVSGDPMGAQNRSLTFMVGCRPPLSANVFPIVESFLRHMGYPGGIFLCGDVGAGTAFKIINNYLSAITSLAASEALNIGVKAGQCWVTSKSNPVPGVQDNVPSSRGYEGGFRIELCAKVLGMCSTLARDVGARTVLDQRTLNVFKEAMEDERYKGKDARVVFKWLNDQ